MGRLVFARHRNPRRGLPLVSRAPPPLNLDQIVAMYAMDCAKREMQKLPDFALGYDVKTLHVLISSGSLHDVRWGLRIILADDGSVRNTAWLEKPKDAWCAAQALCGILDVYAYLADPMTSLISRPDDPGTRQAVTSAIQMTREWVDVFQSKSTRRALADGARQSGSDSRVHGRVPRGSD